MFLSYIVLTYVIIYRIFLLIQVIICEMKKNLDFKVGEYCVYKTHGVAKVKEVQTIELKDFKSKCLVLYFEREKLTVTVPENQIENMGIRKISSMADMEKVFTILSNGVKKIKGMWSRRAKEYEEKINSGDIFLIAEVIRDLTRDVEEADRSFSERMIYETAVYRLASEYSILANISLEEASAKIVEISKQRIKFTDISKFEEAEEA